MISFSSSCTLSKTVQKMAWMALVFTSSSSMTVRYARAFRPLSTTRNPMAIRSFSSASRLYSTNTPQQQQDELEWSTNKVRSTFIDYFETNHEHVFQPSSACAPLNDPTLLFTNAGMNQFKPIFLGQVDPQSPLSKLTRAVNSQKCIRAGGKHNDLEDVGRDTYHHTFFEMLGTWSFGDYFKEQAIDYAWDILTRVYQLEPERLYATYFEGNDAVEPDFEARDFWFKYLPAERVLGCGAADNFWEMGDVGPCGPCSEIHYDRIGQRDASLLVNADDPNVIEIWNIVFIQYNREPSGLRQLPAKHIDTGMGLERLVSILQKKDSNYDIDVFQPIFQALAQQTDQGPYTGKLGDEDATFKDTAYRAIADHARTLSFAIADGAVPNNEGRGYVLRRILRRAVRYGQQILNCPPGFFATLVPHVVETFGDAFPELRENKDTIIQVIQEEEASFGTMLDRGLKYFEELKEELQTQKETQVSGEQAFFLYDTLGFPVDLTELMAQEAGLTVDSVGFQNEMQTQKDRSRRAQKAARSAGTDDVDLELVAEQTAWLSQHDVLPTDDGFKYKWDVELPATVMAIYGEDGFYEEGSTVQAGDVVGLVLDKTSFYAEAGGQETDVGHIEMLVDNDGKTGTFEVTDTQVYAGFILHKGTLNTGGDLQVGSQVSCRVDYDRRRKIAPNHSMTHVLNAALRSILKEGEKVDQRGSLCNDEKLRFDFTSKKALTLEELEQVEAFCQESVKQAEPVTSQIMPLAEAQELPGVRAVFGEVYPDPVRVISIGGDTSIEFCGGTHLENTAEADAFCLIEETAVAKGIRRISAVTKAAAKEALSLGDEFVARVKEAERLSPKDASDFDKTVAMIRKELDAATISAPLKVELRSRIEKIQKRSLEAKKKALQQRLDLVLNDIKVQVDRAVASGRSALVLPVDIMADSKASQRVRNEIKKWAPEMAFMGLSEEDPESGGKLLAFAIVPEALTCELKANEWVMEALKSFGGKGGGKPDNAQGQATNCDDITAVISAAEAFASEKVTAVSPAP